MQKGTLSCFRPALGVFHTTVHFSLLGDVCQQVARRSPRSSEIDVMELVELDSEEWQLDSMDLASQLEAETDLGHILCQPDQSVLSCGRSAGSFDSVALMPLLQALRAVAWCSGWRAANCSRGFGNNARCDEVLLATSCEDAESTSKKLSLSTHVINELLEAIHCSAWHCANSKFGHRLDAEEDLQTAQQHWATVIKSGELSHDILTQLQKLLWSACWCTANWRSGSDKARVNMKMEQRYAQSLGLSKKSAWAPHVNHRRCNREMAWKQRAAANWLFSESLAAIAERGGLKHGKILLEQKLKKCIHRLHMKDK